ncbi:Cof-type HAD-IIB family hydrolase [Roseburia hominis]
MEQVKMIGFDLDGTLLNSQKELTTYTREVLAEAVRQGVVILPATGRPVTGVPKELLAFPGIRYVVASNGGRIVDIKENKLLYNCPVPYELSAEVLRIFDDYDVIHEIYFDGQGYIQEDELKRLDEYVSSPPMADYIRSTRLPIPNLWEKMKAMKGHGLDKVHAIFANADEQKEAEDRIHALGSLEISSAMGHNVEVNASGVNKGNGLLRLGKLLGIRREEIMALGDGNNDLPMIRAAGLGVAMANAIDEVREAADYVTCSNDEDGAAKAIERFVLQVHRI